jgi:hypothetical protein
LLTALLIHLVVPAASVAAYLRLRKRMGASGVQDPPEWRVLVLVTTYGGWVLVLLTAMFWTGPAQPVRASDT